MPFPRVFTGKRFHGGQGVATLDAASVGKGKVDDAAKTRVGSNSQMR